MSSSRVSRALLRSAPSPPSLTASRFLPRPLSTLGPACTTTLRTTSSPTAAATRPSPAIPIRHSQTPHHPRPHPPPPGGRKNPPPPLPHPPLPDAPAPPCLDHPPQTPRRLRAPDRRRPRGAARARPRLCPPRDIRRIRRLGRPNQRV